MPIMAGGESWVEAVSDDPLPLALPLMTIELPEETDDEEVFLWDPRLRLPLLTVGSDSREEGEPLLAGLLVESATGDDEADVLTEVDDDRMLPPLVLVDALTGTDVVLLADVGTVGGVLPLALETELKEVAVTTGTVLLLEVELVVVEGVSVNTLCPAKPVD